MKSAPVRFGSIAARPPLTAPGQRIGLLGGSFNPPHDAHVLISQTALRRLRLDAVWWIVTPGNPLKSHNELADLEERLAACRTLVTRDARIRITSFETELGSPYT
ncbi:MAG: nicotinic acid mononucleotide adenylyltransferase, partial [Pseudomonadota bacterium]